MAAPAIEGSQRGQIGKSKMFLVHTDPRRNSRKPSSMTLSRERLRWTVNRQCLVTSFERDTVHG
jgi:hypothetical protein